MRQSSQRSASGRIRRSVSERQLGEMMLLSTDSTDGGGGNGSTADQLSGSSGGDILTKVAIPRSKSFMTVPQQNYTISELFEEIKV